MAIPIYLAMTAAEHRSGRPLPRHSAWLSCLFSPYGIGVTNLPMQLPPESLLILSDRIPVCGHDAALIRSQLQELTTRLHCCGLLLDFQRPDCPETAAIAAELLKLPLPVAVSLDYADKLDCPVFLPPLPLLMPLREYLAPWQSREVWLDIARQNGMVTVTEAGSRLEHLLPEDDEILPFYDNILNCHYGVQTEESTAKFLIHRGKETLLDLLHEAEVCGVVKAVGLYQEFGQ